MSLSPNEGFKLLKRKVQEEVFESLQIRKELNEWSMQDIQDFQADLEHKCKSTVSEKWIYLHFKNDNNKLPRIDVLNLLSCYCGFKNWENFLFDHTNLEEDEDDSTRPKWILIPVLVLVIAFAFLIKEKEKPLIVYFKDAYTQKTINPDQLQLELKEGSIDIKKDHATLKVKEDDTLSIAAPYFKTRRVSNLKANADTISIKLFPDDYALLLNYFSRSDGKDIEKRQKQLNEAIHSEAKIFQVYEEFEGLEILNKEEFIERITLPIHNLKNLEILDIQYKDEQIFRLRFVQNLN